MAIPSLDASAIPIALAHRVRARTGVAAGQIAVGLAATLAIPALLAALCVSGFSPHRPWRFQPSDLGWCTWFAIWFVLLIPAAYIIEWRTHGGYLIRRLRQIADSDGGWYEAITHDRTWRWGAREGAAQWEIVLFAPRMVYGGFAKFRGMRLVAMADLQGAAVVLGRLLKSDHGVPTDSLRPSGEDALAFARVMSFLLFYDWVGASENGQKVWALTETRDQLRMS